MRASKATPAPQQAGKALAPNTVRPPVPATRQPSEPHPGNQATLRRLTIASAHDPHEAEADRIASNPAYPASISTAPTPTSQPVPPSVHQLLSIPGQPLASEPRRLMESRLGHDLTHVRIHTGDHAAQSAASVHAAAYTVGNHIVFARDRFAPHTEPGRTLLAHELVHTLQQRNAPTPVLQRAPEDTDPKHHHPKKASKPAPARSSLLNKDPLLTLDGHTPNADRQAVDRLLDTQLTIDQYVRPIYLGIPTPLAQIASLLRAVAPTLAPGEIEARVTLSFQQKLAARPNLGLIVPGPIVIPRPRPDLFGAVAALPEKDDDNGASRSLGFAYNFRISSGSGPRSSLAAQDQVTLGDDIQAVLQSSKDVFQGTYTLLGGAQILSIDLINYHESNKPVELLTRRLLFQLQPFVQLLAGLAQVPGSYTAAFNVTVSGGFQLTAKLGPVTLQAMAGVQVVAQQGQPAQAQLTGGLTAGLTKPDPDGSQSLGHDLRLGIRPITSQPNPNSNSTVTGAGLFLEGRF